MAGADRAPAEQRPKLQLYLGGEGERAFGADEDVREIGVVLSRRQRVEIVAADAALHFGKTRLDFTRLARADGEKIARKRL